MVAQHFAFDPRLSHEENMEFARTNGYEVLIKEFLSNDQRIFLMVKKETPLKYVPVRMG